MNKLSAWISAAVSTVAAFALFSPGCANTACSDLAEVCGRCGDKVYRASCEAIVAKANAGVCAGQRPSFQVFCTQDGQGGAGGAGASCSPWETQCGSECVNLLANAKFCGSCNTACNDGELCEAGTCVKATECPPTLPDKNDKGGCTNKKTDPTCCGDACQRCAATTVCVEKSPADGKPGCALPTDCVANGQAAQICNGSCTNTFDDPLNCGKCGNACAPGEVCSAGICAASCGNNLTQCCGKCVDITSNGTHCGGCDPTCPEAASGNGGSGGGAASSSCPGGYQACSGNTPLCSGCTCKSDTQCQAIESKTICGSSCIDTKTDPAHCGSCENACGPGQKCADGACLSGSCPSGKTACNGTCVDVQTDPNNCGSCGTLCGGGTPLCDTGVCVSACISPKQACGSSCVDVSKDPKNCGKCNNACGVAQVCATVTDANGNAQTQCLTSCPAGLTNCGGACVDLRSDFNHCGSCGNTCNDDNVCTADACVFGSKGGTCKNQSGASLCGQSDNPCYEVKCDAKLGCVQSALSPAAIAAGCMLAKAPPGGWSQDDLLNGQANCLWCDATKKGAAACTYSLRQDNVPCTVDTCDPNRLKPPTQVTSNLWCEQNGKDCASAVCVKDLNQAGVDKTTGCLKNNALCSGAPEGPQCCPEKAMTKSGCVAKALSCSL